MPSNRKLLGMPGGKLFDFAKAMSDAGADEELADAIIDDADFAKELVKLGNNARMSRQLFQSPAIQLLSLSRWNQELGWGFTGEEWAEAQEIHRLFPRFRGTRVPVLIPYQETIDETFVALASALSLMHAPAEISRWRVLEDDVRELCIEDETTHPGRCLRWELLRIEPRRVDPTNGYRVCDVRNRYSAHAGGLAALAHFPRWVEAITKGSASGVNLAGYRSRSRKDRTVSWDHGVSVEGNEGRLQIVARRDDSWDSNRIAPTTEEILY